MRPLRKLLPAIAIAAATLPAFAHDTWLARGEAAGVLSLATGERYPLAQVAPAAGALREARCRDARGGRHALVPGSAGATALALAPARGARGPLACWAVLVEHEVELAPALVEVYLREIQPPAWVRSAWAEQQRSGQAWKERYTKHARIELSDGAADARSLRELRRPAGLPLEIVVDGDRALRAGEPAAFRVLSRGAPVEGLAVELLSERASFGVWRRSDAAGTLHTVLPFAGWWLLRATLLEKSGAQWTSRFVTLAFEVQAQAAGRL